MFKTQVKDAIQDVDEWLNLPPVEADWLQIAEDCRSLLSEIERQALTEGLPEAVRACQVAGNTATVQQTRQALAACLDVIPEPDVLTPPQVAKKLRVSPDTVRAWCRSGRLKATNVAKTGTRWKIKKSDLDDFLREWQPEPPPARKKKRRTDSRKFY